jgi:hypothetical protein
MGEANRNVSIVLGLSAGWGLGFHEKGEIEQ